MSDQAPEQIGELARRSALNGVHALRHLAPEHATVEWPQTDRPLNIAIIGWARLSSQGREGSGYNLSKSELARGLALAGHRVSSLASGMIYRLGFLKPGEPHVAKRETWGGIECYELRNSPNVSPAAVNFSNMPTEIADPASTRLVLRWLDQVGAEVVHIHSQEGYGLDLIPAIRASGRPVVVTPHNYWFLCPQVDLFHQEREVCVDYAGGGKCVDCLPPRSADKLKAQRAWGQTLEYALGMYPADVIRKAAYGVKPLMRALADGMVLRKHTVPPLHPDALNDPELALGFETVRREPDVDTTIDHALTLTTHEDPIDYIPAAHDTNEQVLKNKTHRVSLNIYGQRRDAGVGALSSASMVIPPSDYLRKVHVAMGVPEQKTRWVRLGQPHFDQLNRRVRRSPFYDAIPWDAKTATRPLRFAFFGTTRPNKGLEVLVRAIPLLKPEVRQRCQFIIRAMGWDFGFRKRMAEFPEVSVWGGYDLYQLIASVGEYEIGVLPHLWLENSPLVLLENFHAGKMVICSRLGGPVDWVRDPKDHPTDYNGLLFPGGDEQALADAITRLASGEIALPSPRQIHERVTLQSYPAHVAEVEGIYREVLGHGPNPFPAARPAPPAKVVVSAATRTPTPASH